MKDSERQAWIVVGAIFATMFFIWGAINSGALFFLPIVKTFGWTRARFSVALSIGWVTGGAAGPVIGWLADRINPKKMMMVAAAITGLAYFALSRATTFGDFLAIYGLFGISVGASTFIPCALVIASWFREKRGLAMGIAFSGATLGGAAMTPVAQYAIAAGGWRIGYLTLGAPIVLLVVPLILFFVRARSDRAPAASGDRAADSDHAAPAPAAIELPGLELSQATKTRSFWLIAVAQLFAGASIGMAPHFVAYLTGIGYTATFAATVISLYLLLTTAGTLLGGPIADRFSARGAMFVTFILSSLGMLGMAGASHPLALAANVLAGGFAQGAYVVQMPLVVIESLGVKRLGSMLGVTGVFYTLGAAISPVITGRIFDLTGSYSIAITCFIAILILCALVIRSCRSLDREKARFQVAVSSIVA
jgi:MFS family permease